MPGRKGKSGKSDDNRYYAVEREGFTYRLKKIKESDNFYVCWTEGRSQRTSTDTPDEEEAKRWLDNFVKNRHGTQDDEETEIVSVNHVFDVYLKKLKLEYKEKYVKYPEKGKKLYRENEDRVDMLREEFGHIDVYDLTKRKDLEDFQDKIEEYRKAQLAAGKTGSTVRRYLATFTAALNHTENKGIIIKAPYIPKPPPGEPNKVWATIDEIRHFYTPDMQPHIRLFCLLAQWTLARREAILDLKWEQIDLENDLIDYAPAGWVQSNKVRPPVPIFGTELKAALLEARELAQSEYVIEWNGKGVKSVKNSYKKHAQRIGMEWLTSKIFRHSGATHLINLGVKDTQVAEMMGDDVETVRKHYKKHSPEFLGDVGRGLNHIYG